MGRLLESGLQLDDLKHVAVYLVRKLLKTVTSFLKADALTVAEDTPEGGSGLAGLLRVLHELGVNHACAVKDLNCIREARLQLFDQHAPNRTGSPECLAH